MKKLWEDWRKYLNEQEERKPIYVTPKSPWLRKPHLLPGYEVRAISQEEPKLKFVDEPTPPDEVIKLSGQKVVPDPETGKVEVPGAGTPEQAEKVLDLPVPEQPLEVEEVPELEVEEVLELEVDLEAPPAPQKPIDFDKNVSELMKKHGWDEEMASNYEHLRTNKPLMAPLTQSPEKYQALMELNRSGGIAWLGKDTEGRPVFNEFEYTRKDSSVDLTEREVKNLHILTKERWDPETQSWVENPGGSKVQRDLEKNVPPAENIGMTPEEREKYIELAVKNVIGDIVEGTEEKQEYLRLEDTMYNYLEKKGVMKETIHRAILKVLRENQTK